MGRDPGGALGAREFKGDAHVYDAQGLHERRGHLQGPLGKVVGLVRRQEPRLNQGPVPGGGDGVNAPVRAPGEVDVLEQPFVFQMGQPFGSRLVSGVGPEAPKILPRRHESVLPGIPEQSEVPAGQFKAHDSNLGPNLKGRVFEVTSGAGRVLPARVGEKVCPDWNVGAVCVAAAVRLGHGVLACA